MIMIGRSESPMVVYMPSLRIEFLIPINLICECLQMQNYFAIAIC